MAAYHFDTFQSKQQQNVSVVSRDPLIYGFVQAWDVSRPLLLKYEIFGPFWVSKCGLSALAAYHFDTFTCKSYQNIIIVSADYLIYVFVQFCNFSRPLLHKYDILGTFWGSKWGLWVLDAYHFDTFTYEWYQDVLIVSRDQLIYGFIQFWEVSRPLLHKYDILGHFVGQKGDSASWLHNTWIPLNANSTKMSLLLVETHSYMVLSTLGTFLGRFYLNMKFQAHFGYQNVGSVPWLPTILIPLHANRTKIS